ncbi:MAG: protein kinase [Desulfobacteraceae bacterium]|nr:protein kinase [Desulfobacteraceae bacterium]
MAKTVLNCWEFMACGREPGGVCEDELGACPAAVDESFDGINSGENGGRICWAVAGTFCGGGIQGTFAEKRKSCVRCDFFQKVQNEQGALDLKTELLRFMSEGADDRFLNNLALRRVRAGERFIRQGEQGDAAYIIDKGSCLAIVERNGELHPLRHRTAGDIVGLPAILTGEPRMAHIEAETDMELWEIKKSQFDHLSRQNPELLRFFSELVANSFDTNRPIADRSIGKYVITDVIGRGSFSIVYRGKHRDLDMPVAVKMMRHDLALEPEFYENFRNEAASIAALKHDNILRVYDFEEKFRTLFIIMEYVAGESLQDMLARVGTVLPETAANYLVQICAGLRYAHAQNIIHRDINPLNIFVQSGGRIKILDFGLACPVGTETYEFFGMMSYNAPEQISGDPVDARTDIYSLAVLAYEMLTGTKPYPEASPTQVMRMHLRHDIPDPAAFSPGIPAPLHRFILKAGRRDPEKRYPNADEAMAELLPLAGQPGNDLSLQPGAFGTETAVVQLFCDENQTEELNRLLDEFRSKAESAGIDCRISTGKQRRCSRDKP